MKIFLFWLFGITSVVIAFKIAKILIYDIERLTEYGYGYLTGIIILFLFFLSLTLLLGIKIYRKNRLS
jgi:hypothetical protein